MSKVINALCQWGLAMLIVTGAVAVRPVYAADSIDAALAVSTHGPSDVKLDNQAVLHLPARYVFVAQPQASDVLRAMGNPGDHSNIRGLVFPEKSPTWFAVLQWTASGYIKDDDAKDWKADDLLASYRQGTEAQNQERKKMGATELEIVGWAEPPRYDAASHRLVWAMSSREKGAPANAEQGVNYNTYALGREGYMSLNLVTALNSLPDHKSSAHSLLGALEFVEGKRYTDFNASTDHVAEYGLAALVLGVGAKKLGLLAVAGAFFAKFAKIILLAGVGALAALRKIFRRD